MRGTRTFGAVRLSRPEILAAMRVAGAAGDRATFTRLHVENSVSRAVADAEWRAGRAAATRGAA